MTDTVSEKKKKGPQVLLVYKFLSVIKKKCENKFGRNVIYEQPLHGPGAAFQSTA